MAFSKNNIQITSYVAIISFLLIVLIYNLLPALFSALMIYLFIHSISLYLPKKFPNRTSKLIVLGIFTALLFSLFFIAGIAFIAFLKSEVGSTAHLLERTAQIIDNAKDSLPDYLDSYLPSDVNAIKYAIANSVKTHFFELQIAGKEILRVLVQILLGLIIGAMISLEGIIEKIRIGPLSGALYDRLLALNKAFSEIVTAQVKISAINTVLTWVYLGLFLPAIGIQLPLVKTIIVITFIVGLLPVVGNLISNTVITIASLSVSFKVGAFSLLYLVIIHKLEYFLNAKIIGKKIDSRAWELLIVMLTFESIFGISGLIAAPIFYNYAKSELRDLKLI